MCFSAIRTVYDAVARSICCNTVSCEAKEFFFIIASLQLIQRVVLRNSFIFFLLLFYVITTCARLLFNQHTCGAETTHVMRMTVGMPLKFNFFALPQAICSEVYEMQISEAAPTAAAPVVSATVGETCRFPKLEECAHFHYERVQLPQHLDFCLQTAMDQSLHSHHGEYNRTFRLFVFCEIVKMLSGCAF